MTVVADSGPLIAFAKIGGLETLLGVYPRILTPRAVFEESVNEGEYLFRRRRLLHEGSVRAEADSKRTGTRADGLGLILGFAPI